MAALLNLGKVDQSVSRDSREMRECGKERAFRVRGSSRCRSRGHTNTAQASSLPGRESILD